MFLVAADNASGAGHHQRQNAPVLHQILPGARVTVEVSPTIQPGRITYRQSIPSIPSISRDDDEGPTQRQEDLRQVQGCAAAWCRPHHLREPAPQAAPGLLSHGPHRRCRSPAPQAAGVRPPLRLRHRQYAGPGDLQEGEDPGDQEGRGAQRLGGEDHPRRARRRLQGRGRPAPRGAAQHQAPDLGCYRGLRHRRGLPVNGQRTHTNARSRKGPRKGMLQRRPAAAAPK